MLKFTDHWNPIGINFWWKCSNHGEKDSQSAVSVALERTNSVNNQNKEDQFRVEYVQKRKVIIYVNRTEDAQKITHDTLSVWCQW